MTALLHFICNNIIQDKLELAFKCMLLNPLRKCLFVWEYKYKGLLYEITNKCSPIVCKKLQILFS